MKSSGIGGQAVLEGVMMRGPEKTAMAVRKSDGEIVIEEKEAFAEYKTINEKDQFRFGSLNISFLKTDHAVETYAIKVENGNKTIVLIKCGYKGTIRGFNDNSRIVYVLEKDGIIISEATAYIKEEAFIGDINNIEELLSDNRVYLSAFRTDKEYRGKGYFSKLFKFMIDDLKSRGYTEACLGVEPCEVTNMEIYFKYGFTNYIKTSIEYLPAVNDESLPKEEIVSFYYKKLD